MLFLNSLIQEENSNISNSKILYTEKLKDQKLEPLQTATAELNVSKILYSIMRKKSIP